MARKAEPNATAQMIEDLWDKLNEKYDDDYFEIIAEKDMKVIFNTENMSMPWMCDFGDGIGFYEINGTTIALCCAGGDWETPVYFALYVEKGGKKLRMYIPTIGNVFDGYCKTAFGSAGEYGDKMPEDCWPEAFLDEDEVCGNDKYEAYTEYIQAHFSVDDMLKDIGARIEGATPCVPFKKKPLKWDKTAKEWAKKHIDDFNCGEEESVKKTSNEGNEAPKIMNFQDLELVLNYTPVFDVKNPNEKIVVEMTVGDVMKLQKLVQKD